MRLGATLTSLDLSFNGRVSSGTFLASLPRLTAVDLSLNAWADDEVASVVARSMPRLSRLTLEKTETGDAGLAALGALGGSLRYLDLSRTSVRGTEESLAALAKMHVLSSLLLAYCPVDASLCANLPPRLERLKLSRAIGIDDAALHALAQHIVATAAQGTAGGLRSLDVGSPGITDAGVTALRALTHAGLVALTLWHTKISRAGAEALMGDTGLSIDASMGTSPGTYLLSRGCEMESNSLPLE